MIILGSPFIGGMTKARSPVLAVIEMVGACRQELTTQNYFAVNVLIHCRMTFGAFGRRVKR